MNGMSMPARDRLEIFRAGNGQFGNQPRNAPDSDVLESMFTDQQASFEFPPYPTSAEQVKDFWLGVEVPEEVLRSFKSAWDRRQAERHRRLERQWMEQHPAFTAEQIAAQEVQAREWADEQVRANPSKASRLHETYVRPLVRLTKMLDQARDLPAAEEEALRTARFIDPRGNRWSVEGFVDFFDAKPMVDQMVDKRSTAALRNILDKEWSVDL